MDISSVTSVSSVSSNSTSVAALEKQKTALEKKMAEEKASDDDDKVKALKIAQYEQQIQQIQAQIDAQKSKSGKNGSADASSIDEISKLAAKEREADKSNLF